MTLPMGLKEKLIEAAMWPFTGAIVIRFPRQSQVKEIAVQNWEPGNSVLRKQAYSNLPDTLMQSVPGTP